MKILFPARIDAFTKPGGDIVQLTQYIAALNRHNVEAKLDIDLFSDFSEFDIVHLSNLDRPLETYWFYRRARRAGKPVFLSPIHHPYKAIARFERLGRTSWEFRLLNRLLSYQAGEMVKIMIRALKNPKLLIPMITLFVAGFTASQKKILGADTCFLISRKEEEDILIDFGYRLTNPIIIYNNLDPAILQQIAGQNTRSRLRDIEFLCVGRIEPRKNQLAILRAAEAQNLSVTFVGDINPSERKYIDNFQREIGCSRSFYLGPKSREEVIDLMRRAKVHISASWFEVSSLVDIEAHLAGAFVISSMHGATNELINEGAMLIVNPEDQADIGFKMVVASTKAEALEPSATTGHFAASDVGYSLLQGYYKILEPSSPE